ncbi:hypothetical protein FRC12_016380 [Ceratobasidium sp. 428]|nr:hypothetical protein FRC12_016380 [Ceratobasidium sp. 428]
MPLQRSLQQSPFLVYRALPLTQSFRIILLRRRPHTKGGGPTFQQCEVFDSTGNKQANAAAENTRLHNHNELTAVPRLLLVLSLPLLGPPSTSC